MGNPLWDREPVEFLEHRVDVVTGADVGLAGEQQGSGHTGSLFRSLDGVP